MYISMNHKQPIFGVEAAVFGVEASTPPTPLDRTLRRGKKGREIACAKSSKLKEGEHKWEELPI